MSMTLQALMDIFFFFIYLDVVFDMFFFTIYFLKMLLFLMKLTHIQDLFLKADGMLFLLIYCIFRYAYKKIL